MENPDARVNYRDLTVSVRLISPSQDLADFPDLTDLPVSMTVGQVKLLIGNELAARRRSPSGMRVIYRGRVLDIDERTLAEVFGIPTIQETSVQVLHLVLRDGTANTNPRASTAPTNQRSQSVQNPFDPNDPAALAASMRNRAQQILTNLEADVNSPESLQRYRDMSRQQEMRQALQTVDSRTQQQYVQQQRQLHASSPSTARDPAYLVEFIEYDQSVPVLQTGYTEAEQYAFQQLQEIHTTQREIFDTQPQPDSAELVEIERQHLLAVQRVEQEQLHNILEGRRRLRLRIQAQRQSLPQTRLQQQVRPQQPSQQQVRATVAPSVSQHIYPTQATPLLSQRHGPVPLHGGVSPQPHVSATTTGASVGQQTTIRPNVYVLESPSGPRAVLINSNTEAYYTPATQAVPATRNVPVPQPNAVPGQSEQWYVNMIQQHNLQIQQQQQHYQFLIRQNLQHVELLHRLQQQHFRQHPINDQAQQAAPQIQAVPQPAVPAQQNQGPNLHANPHNGHGLQLNNPGAGFLAAMWPHIWLLARLILFVWWFTNPTASWTRWATVILVAIAVFIFNTGMLDEIANQAWAPVRAHLDGLVPMPNGNDRAGREEGQNAQGGQNPAGPAANAAGNAPAADPVGRAGGAEPDPAAAAARLLEQRRRENGRRMQDFARRLERLGIMFLASLAPGIAERHVALAEERDREERRRVQEEAEAAIAAAAEAQARAEAAAAADEDKENEGPEEGTGADQANAYDDDAVAVDAQWQNEQQFQHERDMAYQAAGMPMAIN
ncbi:hypothetical protein SEUCBS139899_005269 [Sporothrix eucalyptigena]|uniref:Ubiquitin-like domain-containing protein n=1 Tax=Sporothrix eucalyptigena TaxID=1812306 RepID=A0ABP0BSH7_9PEZI